MHERLFARQQEWLGKLGRRGQYLEFSRWATELGLDTVRFHACWKERSWLTQVERNTRLARANGIPGTPAFVVNGQPLVGDVSYEQFAHALAQAVLR
jgi:protein-disulfide isomerase